MKKLALLTLLALTLSSINSFATDKTKGKKEDPKKCLMGGSCCKKGASKAAMLKASAKPVAKKTVKV